ISSDAGKVVTAAPTTQPVTGSVARALFAASAYPARPFSAMMVELFVNSSAWQAESTATFFFAISMGLPPGMTGDCQHLTSPPSTASSDYRAETRPRGAPSLRPLPEKSLSAPPKYHSRVVDFSLWLPHSRVARTP